LALAACSSGSSSGGSGAAATATVTDSPTATVPPMATVPPTATASPVPPSATHTMLPPPTSTPEPPTPTDTVPPTATFTPTPLIGPIVSAFGIAEGIGTFQVPAGIDDDGRPVFVPSQADGFVLYVEGRPGPSGLPVGTERRNFRAGDATSQPDLQVQSQRDLGDGSVAVCDGSFPVGGGVPGIDPPQFGPIAAVSDALNDFACRFKVFTDGDFACTQTNNGSLTYADPSSTVQFCTLISEAVTFPRGDTQVSVRLRDTAGNAGPTAAIVVRIN
jgi:hypothetical protein